MSCLLWHLEVGELTVLCRTTFHGGLREMSEGRLLQAAASGAGFLCPIPSIIFPGTSPLSQIISPFASE